MKKFSFKLPQHQKRKMKERKKETGKSIAQQIRDAIHKDLKKEEMVN